MGREYRCCKSVLLTRSEEDIAKDRKLFEDYGFEVLSLPLIRTEPLEFEPPSVADVLVFQSPKAVRFFLERAKVPRGARIVAVGEKTKRALQKAGLRVDLVPGESSAEGIVKAMPEGKGEVVVIPRSEIGRTEVIEGLRRKGYEVVPLNVYRTLTPVYEPGSVEEVLRKAGFVVFASPSAVRGLFANLQKDRILSATKGAVVVAIGRTTKKELESKGIPPDIMPAKPLMEEVAGKIHEFWQRNCTY